MNYQNNPYGQSYKPYQPYQPMQSYQPAPQMMPQQWQQPAPMPTVPQPEPEPQPIMQQPSDIAQAIYRLCDILEVWRGGQNNA